MRNLSGRLTNTGKVLGGLTDEYDLSNVDISRNGGPDTVTLSRIRRGRNMPTTDRGKENVAKRTALGFRVAVEISTGQEYPELEQSVYERIKQALDTDASTLTVVPTSQIIPQESAQFTPSTGIETLMSFYKKGGLLKPAFFRIGGGYDILVDKIQTTVFLRTRKEEGPRKMLVLEQAEFQLQLIDNDRTLLYVVVGLTYIRLFAAMIEMESKLPAHLWHIALK